MTDQSNNIVELFIQINMNFLSGMIKQRSLLVCSFIFIMLASAFLSPNDKQTDSNPYSAVKSAPSGTLKNGKFRIPVTLAGNKGRKHGKLIWSEEFSEDSLNTENWTITVGDGCPQLCGFGNNELQYYNTSNLAVSNGVLSLTARRETIKNSEYTSARIRTQGNTELKYGRIDVRAKLPEGKGIWPAIWLLGASKKDQGWPACGEIDIMELRGSKPGVVCGTLHYQNRIDKHQYESPVCFQLESGKFADSFHVFSIIWDRKKIIWLVDDVPYGEIKFTDLNTGKNDPTFQKEFYFILNVAVGGHYDGNPDSSTAFPQSMEVDYIRVYKI